MTTNSTGRRTRASRLDTLGRDRRRTPRRTVLDTSEFRRSHLREPRGRGSWMFRGADGEERTVWGTLTECRRELPGGTWVVLP